MNEPWSRDDADTAVRREIDELHRFFQEWFVGALGRDALSRFDSVLDDDFRIVAPSGVCTEREPLIALIDGAHGSRESGFRIEVVHRSIDLIAEGVVLAGYEEWQRDGDDDPPRGRLSTAIFRSAPETPNGYRWLHVHETWLPEGASRD